MSLISTRVRGNDPSLPAVLPSIASALSRRRALFGAVTVAGATLVPDPSRAGDAAWSAADARLVAIADEMQATSSACKVFEATHPDAPDDDPEWCALIDRFEPLTAEMEALPADTMAGVMAKARALQVCIVRNCLNTIGEGIADDLHRLFGAAA